MNLKDIQVAIVGKLSDRLMAKVESTFTAYRLWELADEGAFYTQIAPDIQALVTSGNPVMGGFSGANRKISESEDYCQQRCGL
ncbi:putative 2-hydroxyacid dehydrogenase/reductase [Escherichia coli]|nr:putative 2-hydroxyacid dehydrogenase/reductase [Escherichia coli]